MLPTVAQFLRSSLGVPDEDQPDFQGPRPYDPPSSESWDAASQPTAGAGASWAPPAEPQYDPRQYDEGPRETGPAPWTPTSPEGTPASASVTQPAQPQYDYQLADGRTAPPTPGGTWTQMDVRPKPQPVAQEPQQEEGWLPRTARNVGNTIGEAAQAGGKAWLESVTSVPSVPEMIQAPYFDPIMGQSVRAGQAAQNAAVDVIGRRFFEGVGGNPDEEVATLNIPGYGEVKLTKGDLASMGFQFALDPSNAVGMGEAPNVARAAGRAAAPVVREAAQGARRAGYALAEEGARQLLDMTPTPRVAQASEGGATIGRGGAPMEPWKRSGNELYREGIRESAGTRERAQRPVRPGTYYHVVPENYRPGDPLYAADELAARGYAEPSNKWAAENGGDASVWPDRDKVALAESYAEAYAFNQDYLNGRGRILEVTVPPDADAWGVRIARNDEGVPSADRMVPAEWIRPAPEHTGAPYRNMPEPTTAPSRTTVSPPLSPQERIDQMQAILNKMRPDDPMRSAYERAIADTQQQISRGELRGSPASRIWREGRETAARLNAEPGGGVTAAGLGAVPEGALNATNRVLSEGLAGGVGGAVIEQARNPDEDPRTAAARGFAAGAVGFPLATRAIRAGARRAGTGGAERVTAGALGNVPERAPEPRLTVEVLRERLDKVRALRDEARARGDVALERDANDVLGQLTTDLSDAMNARRALEPAITSDVGRRLEDLPITENRGEQVASAAGAREAVRAPASELSAPIRVQPSTADRANAIMPFDPVSAGMGAGAGAELDEDGNPVGVDPLRAGAGAAVAGVMGHTPLGRSLSAKLAADAAKVAAAAKAGAKTGARLNAPIKAADGSKIPLSVRMAQALTDDLAATRWGENVLTDAAGRPRLAENSVARASTQTRINADGIANARIEDDLIPTVTAAEREGLADELSQHLEDMHTFDVLVNVYQRASDATRARLSSRARPPANINAMAEQAGEQAMRQWARESLNTTPETVVERLEGQRQRLAASGQDVRVTELAQTVWDHNRQTLQSLVDSGRMSAADAADIAAAYPHYVPSQPLADLMPDGAARAAGGSGPAVERFDTVGATNTRRGERLNPIIASRNATIERERIAKQNRAFTRFYDMVQGANASGSPLTQASAGPRPNRLAGEVEVSGWVNGKRETVRVPKPIADMLDSAARSGNPDAAMAFWGKVKQMVTETITSRRPAFFAVNLIRDFGDYALKASAELGGPKALPRVVGTYADELGKAFVDVASTLSRNQTLAGAAVSGTAGAAMGPEDQSASERATRGALYALAGGIGTGLAGRKIVPTGKAAEFVARGGGMDRLDAGWRGGQQWLREAQRSGGVVARNPAELARHAADILKDLALFEPMAQIGNRMELVPRTARMRLAERAGENATEAMIRGRDATVDFARGGELLKSWNRLIPFANVTVQGGAQLARTLRDHPAAALTTLAATLGPVMLATEVYNRQTPERAQAYSDIPNYVKDQGVVLMLPWAGTDARGERPNYLWIPTGMATPFVQASRAAMQKVPGLESVEGPGIGETAMSILTMFSPVKGENLSSLAATVVPPIAKQGIELGTNRSTFTGNAIATDSADERASAFGQKVAGGVNRIGQMLGSDSLQEVRPSQVDYLTRQLPAYGDLIQGVSNDMAPTARRGEEQRPVQNMPVLGQSAGRIVRDTGGANLERAQQEALSDDTRAILQEAGVRPSEIQMAVPAKYKNATLTRDEQLDWQQAFNDVVDRRISQVTRSAEWRARGADQGKLLREAVSDARETAASRALRRLTEQEIQRRTREQAARKAS